MPTVYGSQRGPDLDRVADVTGLAPDEVIDICATIRLFDYFTREGQETFTGSVYIISPLPIDMAAEPKAQALRGPGVRIS